MNIESTNKCRCRKSKAWSGAVSYGCPVHVDGEENEDEKGLLSERPKKTEKWLSSWPSLIRTRRTITTLLALIFGVPIILWLLDSSSSNKSCDDVDVGYQCKPQLSHHWGQYSPYFSVKSEIPHTLPKGCKITFAQVLSRHGARHPTSTPSAAYNETVLQLKKNIKSFEGKYAFLKDYEYNLGADDLTTFGQQEMVNSGIKFFKRYKALAKLKQLFVRSGGQERVVQSAQNFSQGFNLAASRDEPSNPVYDSADILIIPEVEGENNTLSVSTCPLFKKTPVPLKELVLHYRDRVFQPIRDRLNEDLPGAELTNIQAIQLMDLCPFNTVFSDTGKISPFCNLFNDEEWKQYDYFKSFSKYYLYGNGHPLAPTVGVGFVNELIARMTGRAVKDHTSTNSTLDSDPKTFPIGEEHVLFADFSHDNDMMTHFSALGLYNATKPLSNETRQDANATRGFAASWMIPFAARAYFEKMQCDGEDEELVRVLVNDRVVPLQNCDADKKGRCKLSDWVESLSFARNGGHWDLCYD